MSNTLSMSGQQHPSPLPRSVPVCFVIIQTPWSFYGARVGEWTWGASLALCWLVTAECLVGWMGGDAVISAAMPLQPSPVWRPALSHPRWPRRHVLTTNLPDSFHLCFLPSWAQCGLHPLPDLFGKSSLSERKKKEEKKIYICIII